MLLQYLGLENCKKQILKNLNICFERSCLLLFELFLTINLKVFPKKKKLGSEETPGVTRKFGLGIWNEARQRLIEFCQENTLVIANTLFQQHNRSLYTCTSLVTTKITLIIFFAVKDGEALHSKQKQD